MSLHKVAAILIFTMVIIGSVVKERRDAAAKQRHVIYDEASWFVG